MPLFPTFEALVHSSAYSHYLRINDKNASKPQIPSQYRANESLYKAWSTSDDVKAKAAKIGDAAAKEFEKASNKAQATTGKIELYSAKFYAACTFGGLVACV
jgi:solute carrier family 25 phosphate transporter 3